jgi:hypothetical protein
VITKRVVIDLRGDSPFILQVLSVTLPLEESAKPRNSSSGIPTVKRIPSESLSRKLPAHQLNVLCPVSAQISFLWRLSSSCWLAVPWILTQMKESYVTLSWEALWPWEVFVLEFVSVLWERENIRHAKVEALPSGNWFRELFFRFRSTTLHGSVAYT